MTTRELALLAALITAVGLGVTALLVSSWVLGVLLALLGLGLVLAVYTQLPRNRR